MAELSLARCIDRISHRAQALDGAPDNYNRLLDSIGNADIVLLGEASHGTHEFYRERARLTRRLILEKGFNAVAVEADWPDAYQANRYVLGTGESLSAAQALDGFKRFPTWMWRNTDVVAWIDWLRAHNESRPEREQVGFFGLDLYSFHASVNAVIGYLEGLDPAAAREARQRYGCFDHYGDDMQRYGMASYLEAHGPCQDEVLAQMEALRRHALEYTGRDVRHGEDDFFDAEQNARVARNAEAYYRAMFHGRVESWNLRDQHMAETLDTLIDYLNRRRGAARVVVWAHNSHVGDARFTEMGRYGEFNIGQLARQKYGPRVFNLGFSTYTGTVTAAREWGEPAMRRHVRRALPGSYEQLFHQCGIPGFLLDFRQDATLAEMLANPMLERAIGVIYAPHTERHSHYFRAELSRQFDAVIHLDETRAVVPLETNAAWEAGEVPETYPSAL